MLLIVTNKYDEHADLVAQRLNSLHVPFFRLNTEDFPSMVNSSLSIVDGRVDWSFVTNLREIRLDDVSAVWYRRPFPSASHPIFKDSEQYTIYVQNQCEAFLHDLWHLSDVVWVNHPYDIRRANSKGLQLRNAYELGFSTPKTLVTNDPVKAKEFVDSNPNGVVIKPLYQIKIKDGAETLLGMTHKLIPEDLEYIEEVVYSPTIFQEYIDKLFELRITIFGDKVFTVKIDSQSDSKGKVDWRRSNSGDMNHEIYKIPRQIEDRLLELNARFNLKFSAIDMIVTHEGKYVYLETNPNGQWIWLEHLTGAPMMDALLDLLGVY